MAKVKVTTWSSSVGTNVVMIALMDPSLRRLVGGVKWPAGVRLPVKTA